jgi:hypothetical protein
VRRQAYQSVFSGAAGHTYGACEIYEFHNEGAGKAQWTVGIHWRKAPKLPGSRQMGYLRRLIESHTPATRVPDSTLIASPNPEGPNEHLAALRDRNGNWAMIYTPTGEPFQVSTHRFTPVVSPHAGSTQEAVNTHARSMFARAMSKPFSRCETQRNETGS